MQNTQIHSEKRLNKGEGGWRVGERISNRVPFFHEKVPFFYKKVSFFHKKVPFQANTERCPKFLEYVLLLALLSSFV